MLTRGAVEPANDSITQLRWMFRISEPGYIDRCSGVFCAL